MKKLGLIALAVVMALGAIGVGYAYWTDTLTITGTVETGNLEVGIKAIGDDDNGLDLPASTYNAADTTLVNAGSPIGTTGYYKALTFNVEDGYPGYVTGATVEVKNLGTVPAKIIGLSFVPTGNFDLALLDMLGWSYTKNGAPVASGTTIESMLMAGLQNQQLDSQDYAQFDVNFKFDEGMTNNTQNKSESFTITVIFGQFNDPTTPTLPY